MQNLRFSLLVIPFLAACSLTSSPEDVAGTQVEGLGSKPLPRPATIYRYAHGGSNLGWSPPIASIETATGDTGTLYLTTTHVEAGAKLAVRTTSDGLYTQGQPVFNESCGCCEECDPWTYPTYLTTPFTHWFVGWKVDGVVQPEVDVTSAPDHEAVLDVPTTAKDRVEYWLRFADASGASTYDSAGGANYVIPIAAQAGATIVLDDTGKPKVSGTLAPGGSVRVEYDIRRLGATGVDPVDMMYSQLALTFGSSTMHDELPILIPAKAGATADVAANAKIFQPARVALREAFRIPLDATTLELRATASVANKNPGDGADTLVDGDGGVVRIPASDYTSPRPKYTFAITGACPAGHRCDATQASFSANVDTVFGQEVYAVGSIPELGGWDPTKAPKLTPSPYPSWTKTIELPKNASFEWKLVKIDAAGHVTWEPGSNRVGKTTADSTSWFGGTWGWH
jgi:hypothetical protein